MIVSIGALMCVNPVAMVACIYSALLHLESWSLALVQDLSVTQAIVCREPYCASGDASIPLYQINSS